MATLSSILGTNYVGQSGYSGFSGQSGYSGASTSGFSGIGVSGYSGISGYSGASTSGFSGISGYSGRSGFSGISGYSGSGISGYSGSGISGYSGSGISGYSGYSGSGISGYSGYSGYSGSNRVPQNSQSAAYILALADVGKHIDITTGGVTVPNTIFSAGDVVSVYNDSTGNQTITQGINTTIYLAGTATTGNRTLAQRGVCTLLCVSANTFVIFGAGLT